MTKHIHADLMMQYAEDAQTTDKPWELWECGCRGCDDSPRWDSDLEYRRKPKTVRINGHDVPAPETKPLPYDKSYYMPYIDAFNDHVWRSWNDVDMDHDRLEDGLVHLTEEAAIAHAKALLDYNKD